MIETYLLEQLSAVARCGTLSAAAEELHISQPALSRAMKKLEGEIGVTLFDRTANSIRLNGFGEEAAHRADEILAREADMIFTLREMERRTRTVSIGSCAPMPMYELQRLIGEKMVSKVISAEMSSNEKLLAGLRAGAYDIIAVNEPVRESGYVCKKLFTEHLFAYLMPGHPLSERAEVSFKDLSGETIIASAAIGVWRDVHYRCIPNAHFIELSVRDDLNRLRDSSSLMTFATNMSLKLHGEQPPRVAVPISDPEAYMTFYAVYRSGDKRFTGCIPDAT